ncbi:Aminoacyl-tRNA synthetase, class I, conserved site-containing protein [Artemisia annua]|uniref:Aminoacyl-tRNA synthetase, class I, conserved site-containing protein n=1 Tax=Artemisia annua TaxID=35608 RepID=A0A2U1NZS4_ARTAN|nr:Aminoacyl-tRNA synthetase, class I, conserved site-containing protein [Artemisia annua]
MDLKLLIALDETPPLSVLAVASLAAVSLTVNPSLTSESQPVLVLNDGKELRGTNEILRYLGRTATTIPSLYERDDTETSQIDYWLEYALTFSSGSKYEGACKHVDEYLLQCTFLVGHSLSIADITIWSYLAVGKRWQSLMKSKKYPSVTRWYNMISSEFATVLNDFTSAYTKKKDSGKPVPLKLKENGQNNGQQGPNEVVSASNRHEVDLPYAEMGKVVVRFAPEPSGYLHIGHAKAALLNEYFAQNTTGK